MEYFVTFNSINHDILLSKCEFYGFRGKSSAPLWSCLSDRYQRVLINNSSSNTTTFSEGANRTWCSSRFNTWSFILRNLYKWSSEYNSWPIETILFANDTSIVITNLSPSKFKEDINNIIDNISDWFIGNSSLNFDKINFLQFRPKNNHEINIKISYDNKLIKETKNRLGIDCCIRCVPDEERILDVVPREDGARNSG